MWVPSRLGYGIHGADPLIPPNTDLVFELKLVAVRNEFDVGGQDDNEPLDPRQLDHINQGISTAIELTVYTVCALQQPMAVLWGKQLNRIYGFIFVL